MADFPIAGMALTQILVVNDIDRAHKWYRDVLGANSYREYGGSSVVMQFMGTWLLLVMGGGPTADKPAVTFAPLDDPNTVSHAMSIRVADCYGVYETLKARGAEFLTAPVNHDGKELRAFFRDPDGHLFEISQVENVPSE